MTGGRLNAVDFAQPRHRRLHPRRTPSNHRRDTTRTHRRTNHATANESYTSTATETETARLDELSGPTTVYSHDGTYQYQYDAEGKSNQNAHIASAGNRPYAWDFSTTT